MENPKTGSSLNESRGTWAHLAVLALLAVGLAGLLSGCCGVISAIETGFGLVTETPKPVLDWDRSPENVVMQAARPIQHYQPSISPRYMRNYIPEGRVFGDGRIIWTIYSSNGARAVKEGHLTTAQMTALLQRFLDAGFFSWNVTYSSWLPYDNPPSDYLMVRLRSGAKTVSVTMVEPPVGYNDLFYTLSTGSDAASTDFKPQQATLIAQITSDQAKINWDAEGLNLDLSKAANGIPVEGKALQLAWDLVNQNPFFPAVVSMNGVAYNIFVLVPGLMYY